MSDEKIKIKCTKCSMMFRERGQRIRPGYQMQCPHCLKLLTLAAQVTTMFGERSRALTN